MNQLVRLNRFPGQIYYSIWENLKSQLELIFIMHAFFILLGHMFSEGTVSRRRFLRNYVNDYHRTDNDLLNALDRSIVLLEGMVIVQLDGILLASV